MQMLKERLLSPFLVMPTEQTKDEIFWLFERSVKPKLEVVVRPPPKNIGCVVAAGSKGLTTIPTVTKLATKWDADVVVFVWLRYFNRILRTLQNTKAEEEVLSQKAQSQLGQATIRSNFVSILSPRPEIVEEVFKEIGERDGFSRETMIKWFEENQIDLLVLPLPLFEGDTQPVDSMGGHLETLLRKAPRSLPVLLCPDKRIGKPDTVVVAVRPAHMPTMASRVVQFFDENTRVILVGTIEDKVLEGYVLAKSDQGEEGETVTVDEKELEEELLTQLRRALEQLAATIGDHVESVIVETTVGSPGTNTREIVEKHDACSILVYSESTIEDALDPFMHAICRAVDDRMIFIIWD